MSFFDPQHLYSHRQNYSHHGQVNRKKPVKRKYALTDNDLKESIQCCQAYGYYVSRSPPSNPDNHILVNTYHLAATPQIQNYSYGWNLLYTSINNTYILQYCLGILFES